MLKKNNLQISAEARKSFWLEPKLSAAGPDFGGGSITYTGALGGLRSHILAFFGFLNNFPHFFE